MSAGKADYAVAETSRLEDGALIEALLNHSKASAVRSTYSIGFEATRGKISNEKGGHPLYKISRLFLLLPHGKSL
jgi:hypothetical protein